MSTYKVQPVYAELALGWLDLTHLEVKDASFNDVLRTVDWTFKGGTLGDYPMRFPTDSSHTRFPTGNTAHLAQAGGADADYCALEALVQRRRRMNPKKTRALADWFTSYAAARWLIRDSARKRPVSSGLHAVYSVMAATWDYAAASRHSSGWEKLMQYVYEETSAGAAASHMHVPTCQAIANSARAALARTRIAAVSTILREFTSMLQYTGSPEARSNARRAGKRLMTAELKIDNAEPPDLHLRKYHVGPIVYTAGHGWAMCSLGDANIMLSRSDLVRVNQMLSGICSGLFATVTQACVAPGAERARASEIGLVYEAQVSRIFTYAKHVPQGDEVYTCKGLKRAFGAYLGELAGPMCASETVELWAEALSTKHADSGILTAWVGAIRPWSASTAFNLGKVYKLCPAPDASPALTLLERHEMVTNRNVMDPAVSASFEVALRDQILRAYIRTPGTRLTLRNEAVRPSWWAAYRDQRFEDVPTTEIHTYLAWEGTAVMPSRSPQDPGVWKDSGLGWDTVDESQDPERAGHKGNMLMRMVFDKDCPMPGVRHIVQEHVHKIDTKPEGHKDPARGIYSGNIKERLNQSWMEAAVEAVAHYHPAYMIGADAEVREDRVKALTDRVHEHDQLAVYYSFDISGWSPRMPPEAQRISHGIWAELYDEVLFRTAHTINEGSKVYMNKGGYTGWFVNPGANFEGYNGKEMTMILIALMGRTVEVWRAMLILNGLASEREAGMLAAMLLAYIDDGLAKLVLPRARAAGMFELFKQCTVTEFGKCGYNIEVSKCYPSDRFAVFLNEPYLAGRHVVHGTRAAMTICAENTEPHTTLIERVTSASTGCRGAVTAGLDGLAGTMLQAFHTYRHIQEWVRWPDPVSAAIWSNLPRAWGGLGLPSTLQLSTSGGGASTEESVYTMQQWARINPSARRVFLSCARSEMAERSSMGTLTSPLGGRLAEGPMIDTRVPEAVRTALSAISKEGRLSPLALEFLAYASQDSLGDYAAALVPMMKGAVLQEQLLLDLASAHPHAIFSAFARRVEKSATLIKLVGFRTVNRLIRENRKDAARSYRVVRHRAGVS